METKIALVGAIFVVKRPSKVVFDIKMNFL